MKKKLLSLALVLVLALTLLPTAAFATDGENLDAPPTETSTTENKQEPADPTTEPTTSSADTTDTTETINTPESAPANTTLDSDPDLDNPGTNPQEDPPAGGGGSSCTHMTTKWVVVDDDQCKEVCADTNCGATVKTQAHDLEWTHTDTTHTQTCKNCKTVKVNAVAHVYDQAGDTCVCGATKPASNPTPPTTQDPATCQHLTKTPMNAGSVTPATCKAEGVKGYYQCAACKSYFIDGAINTALSTEPTTADLKIPVSSTHTPPASSSFTAGSISETKHTYTCTVCSKEFSDNHVYESGKCKVCGFPQPSTSNPPSPYRYIDISSAYVNSYSFTVTWASDLPDGTRFDIYLDNTWYTTVTPSKSGNYFSATVSTSRYLDDSYYYVSVYQYGDHTVGDSVKVYGRYYDRDHYYWDGYWEDGYWHPSYRPDYNTTPSTNSSGIPYASQVTGRYSASEAIRILRNTNSTRLQNELMGSSSARSSYDSLERAVKSANNVSVAVSTDRTGVPSALRAGSGVQISGAAFNASSTNSTVRLVVDAPSVNRYVGHGYQFSMSLTGVGNDSSLDVPVVVSMPLPSDINSNFVRVLHYHNSNVPTVITPQVSGGRIRFTLTGFSDFVITDNGVPYTYVSDGLGGYYVRRDLTQQQLAVALPILTTVPTGYVYTDVSGNYWASSEIAWAQSAGILSGYTDGTFRPYSGTTRQELWMVLARLSGANPAHMQAARDWAMNAGITDGRNPESPLSHQQMITMLYRYASYRGMNLAAPTTNLSLYRDSASISPYARTPMAWAINRGIVTGNGTGYLNPQNIASRADFAVYLYRFVQ